jgi:small subunit ribosomal protein S10
MLDFYGRGHIANAMHRLWKSQQRIERDFKKWEPKTADEARKRWKEAQDTPDHTTLLHMYKRAGVEPIKLAKYVTRPLNC